MAAKEGTSTPVAPVIVKPQSASDTVQRTAHLLTIQQDAMWCLKSEVDSLCAAQGQPPRTEGMDTEALPTDDSQDG
ncbi:UNVERIFIED_CONTAM: hypothetical protein K2H54_007364 [Gekko kuhli]